MSELTRVQALHLELIRGSSFNAFDGAIVAEGLMAHRELWVGVIAAHSHWSHPAFRLFEEIPEDEWSPDTLWIMALNPQAGEQLVSLCRQQWAADEVGIYDYQSDPEMSNMTMVDDEVLVRAWWD